MKRPACPLCGAAMKGNGSTSSGRKRWRCPSCGSSSVRRIDSSAKRLDMFLGWLLSRRTQAEMCCPRSTFKRLTSEFWGIWPIARATGEVCDVVHLDGIWLGREAVVLVARSPEHVLAWQLARSECSAAWAALMARVPAPAMAVTDGGTGFAKAARAVWPGTRIQRCTFHAFCQVRRYTTSRPKLPCGQELYGIALGLLKVRDAEGAARWLASYASWHAKWERFLREFRLEDGRKRYVHERLRTARSGLDGLVKSRQLFTFVEMGSARGGSWPSTNNCIESTNAQLRGMLRDHRGLSTVHEAKACFWWLLMHTECPPSAAEILRTMPRDEDVAGLFAAAASGNPSGGRGNGYGCGIDWNEFHMPTEFRQ
jgi:hypothetical protein